MISSGIDSLQWLWAAHRHRIAADNVVIEADEPAAFPDFWPGLAWASADVGCLKKLLVSEPGAQ